MNSRTTMIGIIGGVLLLLLLSGCASVACNKPYIVVGGSCCLDKDDNAVCDTDEPSPQQGRSGAEKSPSSPPTLGDDIARITAERTKEITNQILGGGVPEHQEAYTCNISPKPREFNKAPYYTGPLIDTHVHMPVSSKIFSDVSMQSGFEDMPHVGTIPIDSIVCLFDSEGITKTFGFFIVPNILRDQPVQMVKKIVGEHPGKFVPFFMPPFPSQTLRPTTLETDQALAANPGLFQGYGEVRLDFLLGENLLPEDTYLLDMYSLSDKHNLIVQIHPAKGQLDDLQRVLEKYPDVIFLAHVMPTEREGVADLMDDHPNLYYSIDAEINFLFGYQTIQNNKGPTKEEYLTFLRKNFDRLLTEAVITWKPLIEAHPDQYTWGSDRWFTWHYDPEVGGLVEELSRSFIGQLDPAVQKRFAYENAEKMLRER